MPRNLRTISGARLLLMIRDGTVKSRSDLLNVLYGAQNEVDLDVTQGLGFDHALTSAMSFISKFEEIGFIEIVEGNIRLSQNWTEIQRILGINSMSALARLCDENGMVVAPFFGNPKNPPINAEIFVLMPFRDELKPVYEDHMCTVAKNLNLSIARADDFFTAHVVMHDVWNGICAARVVIADCTDRNPNVFYEIGLAHVVGKPVILLAQQEEDIPFDIRHIRCVKYQVTPRGMKDFERNLEGTLKMSLRL